MARTFSTPRPGFKAPRSNWLCSEPASLPRLSLILEIMVPLNGAKTVPTCGTRVGSTSALLLAFYGQRPGVYSYVWVRLSEAVTFGLGFSEGGSVMYEDRKVYFVFLHWHLCDLAE